VSARTLTEVAELMGLAKVMKEPERFLTRQIKAGKIRARKFGRHWLMTDADVEFALEQFANTITETEVPEAAPVGVPSIASMRRRRLA
jgi:excisionase family DNA binding protein